jgi:triosephosphate isomerase (TIM)
VYRGIHITPPFFEFGPKAYLYGRRLLELALAADRLSDQYGVQVIITPQTVDIPLIAANTRRLLVFAQHMDALPPGRGVGSILPEALKEAGAVGVLLNHVEKRLRPDELERTIKRADEVGLASMACADGLEEVEAVACMQPNILLAESAEMIEGGSRDAGDQAVSARINRVVWNINPEIRVLHGAGIRTARDVYNVMASGAQAAGSTSGIILADDPAGMLAEMIRAARAGWDDAHKS